MRSGGLKRLSQRLKSGGGGQQEFFANRIGDIPPKKYSTDIPIFWRMVRFARRSSGTGIASTKVLVIMFEMPEEYVSSVLRVHWADDLEVPS